MIRIILVSIVLCLMHGCSDEELLNAQSGSNIDFKNQAKIANLEQTQFIKVLKKFADNIPLDSRTGKCTVEIAGADFNNDTHGDFAMTSRCSPENRSTDRRVGLSWDLFLAYVNPTSTIVSAEKADTDVGLIEYKKLSNIYFSPAQILVKPHQKNVGLLVMYMKENAWEGNIVEITVDYNGLKRLSKTKAEKNEQGKALLEKTFNDKTFFPIFNSYRLSAIEAL